jgi:ankyrin repeat protein
MVRSILAFAVCLAVPAVSQSKVDFARDVQPIFRQNCLGCHGPNLATSGLRLDRKSSVFKDSARRVVPGSTQNSFLYHRLIGAEYGLQMPPTGPLKPAQIATIKAWIEQGAEWPDALSNESSAAPSNPQAVAAVESLRSGDTRGFLKAMMDHSDLLNARGPEGSTPFMYAALYGDAALLEQLVRMGAKVNAKNDAGATALMWASTDLAKTRLLVAHGADVNAISEDLRTPLMIAAASPTGRPVVKFLLEKGAKTNPTKHPDSESSPLTQAALAADPEMMQMLLDHGADLKASAVSALSVAFLQNCAKCVDLLMKRDLDKDVYTAVLPQIVYFADTSMVRTFLDRGAQIDAPDPLGHTALAYAAGSDLIPTETVKLLIERGAKLDVRSPHQNSRDTGMSVLDIAKLRGDTPVTGVLAKAGAMRAVADVHPPKASGAASVQAAIGRSLPLLQKADAGFSAKSGCISCHSDSLVEMAVGLARSRGFHVDEALSKQQLRYNVANLTHNRDLMHQAEAGGGPIIDTFNPHILGYQLIALAADNYPADLDTDAAAMYIKARQMPDGSWPYPTADTRPPLCSDHIGQTALSLRALQLYAPKAFKADYEKAVAQAAAWLATAAVTNNTEDHLWKVLGLAWAGRDPKALANARRDLLALQRQDGGWGGLATLPSDAYSTGKALVALQLAGMPGSDPAIRRGTEYLLKNQLADGSWYVKTRALALQPYFETGFPHGVDQSISTAGTSWATVALLMTSGTTESSLAER